MRAGLRSKAVSLHTPPHDLPPAALHIILDDRLELAADVLAPEGHRLLAVDEDGGRREFAGAGQRDADVGMFRPRWRGYYQE